jgi:hypothetical protein
MTRPTPHRWEKFADVGTCKRCGCERGVMYIPLGKKTGVRGARSTRCVVYRARGATAWTEERPLCE